MDKRPVTLLTGFLGSGKTTLLNALLKRPELTGTAVVINEFGETGIDHLLVERAEDTVQLLEGGCICCTVRTTLADTLTEMLGKVVRREVPSFSRVVVETTGLAEPEPMVRQLWADAFMREHFVLDAIVVTIDTSLFVEQLERHAEARRQLAAADRIVLTKSDLSSDRQRAIVDTSIDMINKCAIRMTAEEVRQNPASIVGIGPLVAPARRERLDAWLAAERGVGIRHSHKHSDRFVSVAFTISESVTWEAIATWCDELRATCGPGSLRCKGIVHVTGERTPFVLQGVARVFHPPVRLPGQAVLDLESRIVVICEGVDRKAIEATFRILSHDAKVVKGNTE